MTSRKVKPMAIRFWSKVNKLGPMHPTVPTLGKCWDWTGATTGGGYGHISRGRRDQGMTMATHVALELTGMKVPSHLMVLHSCDRKVCVNPQHLHAGTAKQNSDEMVTRGRSLKGELQPRSKVTADDVREMRHLRQTTGMSYRALGTKFGLHNESVREICNREKWTHVH